MFHPFTRRRGRHRAGTPGLTGYPETVGLVHRPPVLPQRTPGANLPAGLLTHGEPLISGTEVRS